MDVIGTTAAIVGIVDVLSRAILKLHDIHKQLQEANLTVSGLIGELTATKAALNELHGTVVRHADDEQHYDLVLELDTSLDAAHILITYVDARVSKLLGTNTQSRTRNHHSSFASPAAATPLDFPEDSPVHRSPSRWDARDSEPARPSRRRAGPSLTTKLTYILADRETSACLTRLSRIVVALNIVRQSIECTSLASQHVRLSLPQNRRVLQTVRDDATSLRVMLDNASDGASLAASLAASTTRSSVLDRRFAFDGMLLGHRVYQEAFRQLVKRANGTDEAHNVTLEEGTTPLATPLHDGLPRLPREGSIPSLTLLPHPTDTATAKSSVSTAVTEVSVELLPVSRVPAVMAGGGGEAPMGE